MKNKFKKFALIGASLLLCSCNGNGIDGHYEGVHIFNAETIKDYHVISWLGTFTGVQVETEELGRLYLTEGTYVLFESVCPICGTRY